MTLDQILDLLIAFVLGMLFILSLRLALRASQIAKRLSNLAEKLKGGTK